LQKFGVGKEKVKKYLVVQSFVDCIVFAVQNQSV